MTGEMLWRRLPDLVTSASLAAGAGGGGGGGITSRVASRSPPPSSLLTGTGRLLVPLSPEMIQQSLSVATFVVTPAHRAQPQGKFRQV